MQFKYQINMYIYKKLTTPLMKCSMYVYPIHEVTNK